MTMTMDTTTWTPLDMGWLLLAQRVLTSPRRLNLLLVLAEAGEMGCTLENLATALRVAPDVVRRELADLTFIGLVKPTSPDGEKFALASHPLKPHIERLARHTQRAAISAQ